MGQGMAPKKEPSGVYKHRFPLKIRHGSKIYAARYGIPKNSHSGFIDIDFL